MAESNLVTLINEVCRDAGKNKGIEFHLPAALGAQMQGRWEVSYRLKRQGWSVIVTYWFSSDSWVSEEVHFPWAFPPTLEQSDQFKSDIGAKMDQMLEWVNREEATS